MFWQRFFLEENYQFFSFEVYSIVDSMQTAYRAILFCEMFHCDLKSSVKVDQYSLIDGLNHDVWAVK